MARKAVIALGAAALAVLLASALSVPADARRDGGNRGWSGGGHRGHSGWNGRGLRFRGGHRHRGHGHRHRHFDRRVPYYVPFYFNDYYYGDYGYSYGCAWLRRRALYTGSPYWWRRYRDCLDDLYD